jgi:hypothetical protein
MTIPKRFEELLEEARIATNSTMSEAAPMSEQLAKVKPFNSNVDAAPQDFSTESILIGASKDSDKIAELVQEFGLTAGGNKLTTWE